MRSTAACSGSPTRCSCSRRATSRSRRKSARASSRRASSTSRSRLRPSPYAWPAMKIGLIGAGNMATALARGGGEPVAVADIDHGRAQALVSEVGGEAPGSNAYVADAADAVVLCHKPAQLAEVAEEIRDRVKAVISILGGTPVADVEAAYPGLPVYRFMPNIPAEVGHGVFCYAPGSRATDGPEQDVLDMFGRIGTVIKLPEALIDPATALMGCGP